MASRISEILLRAKVIDDLQLRSALAHQQQWGGRLPHIIVEKRFASEVKVTDAIAEGMKLPKVDLDKVEQDASALSKVDMEFARTNAVFPCALKDNGKTLWLAMADPADVPVMDQLAQKTRVRIKLVVASERQILAAIKRAYQTETPGEASTTGLAYGALASIDESSEEDGKIVDMAGHTLIKNIKDIVAQAERSRAEPKERDFEETTQQERLAPPTAPRSTARTDSLLDDLLGDRPLQSAWSEADLDRLRVIQDQQEKGARILRAVLDLCVAKGRFVPDEYRQKLKAGR